MDAGALDGGFDQPAVDAAIAFRAALQAMARPGTVHEMAAVRPPAPLSPAAGALLLMLTDHETPLWLAPSLDVAPVRDWLRFHTGAPLADRGRAAFAAGRWAEMLPLSDFPVGTPEYPDRSATLIVELDGTERHACVTGPGIRDRASLALPDPAALRANAALFPLGLDFFLTEGTRVAALPRTARVEG